MFFFCYISTSSLENLQQAQDSLFCENSFPSELYDFDKVFSLLFGFYVTKNIKGFLTVTAWIHSRCFVLVLSDNFFFIFSLLFRFDFQDRDHNVRFTQAFSTKFYDRKYINFQIARDFLKSVRDGDIIQTLCPNIWKHEVCFCMKL